MTLQGKARTLIETLKETVLKETPNAKRMCCCTRDSRIPLMAKFGFQRKELLGESNVWPWSKGWFVKFTPFCLT